MTAHLSNYADIFKGRLPYCIPAENGNGQRVLAVLENKGNIYCTLYAPSDTPIWQHAIAQGHTISRARAGLDKTSHCTKKANQFWRDFTKFRQYEHKDLIRPEVVSDVLQQMFIAPITEALQQAGYELAAPSVPLAETLASGKTSVDAYSQWLHHEKSTARARPRTQSFTDKAGRRETLVSPDNIPAALGILAKHFPRYTNMDHADALAELLKTLEKRPPRSRTSAVQGR